MLQPENSVIEICYVTHDMDATIDHWINIMGAGPFFVGDMELTENQFHRGEPCEQAIKVGFGFSGGVLIELVQPLRDIPSVFKEVLDTTGPGYHHVMMRVDYDEGYERYSRAGYEVGLHSILPGGERCTLFDARKDTGGFLEVMEMSESLTGQIETIAKAHQEWDRTTRPVRPMMESFGAI